mmetsp:Transcript_172816/g.548734  ORF Transcript_172816/g.548734 Transcript_172816/m.548734 type:complete len:225 (+) Transcript_172816:327-1001(+)
MLKLLPQLAKETGSSIWIFDGHLQCCEVCSPNRPWPPWPHAKAAPSRAQATEWQAPAAMPVTSSTVGRGTGASPLPTPAHCPYSSSPSAKTQPARVRNSACRQPAATRTTCIAGPRDREPQIQRRRSGSPPGGRRLPNKKTSPWFVSMKEFDPPLATEVIAPSTAPSSSSSLPMSTPLPPVLSDSRRRLHSCSGAGAGTTQAAPALVVVPGLPAFGRNRGVACA